MQGKIFAKSMNLYQDEARILFDYYKKAAEKIVAEETALEKSIEAAETEIKVAEKSKIKGIVIPAGFPVAAALLGIFVIPLYGFTLALGSIWGIVTIVKANRAKRDNETKIQGFEEAHRDIRRNYSVKKMGVVYVPVATRVPFEDKSFMLSSRLERDVRSSSGL